jgi:tripartite-type tricarboxylate transporter receptor subunit TctC
MPLALLVAALLLATGCGSGASGSGKAQTPQEFAQGYTTATTAFQSRLTELQQHGRAALGTGDQTVIGIYMQLLDSTRKAATDFRALTPPSSVKSAYSALLSALDAQVKALQQTLSAAKGNDKPKVATALSHYASALSNWLQASRSLQTAVPALSTSGT